MIATLQFTLPEEQDAFALATSAGKLHSALCDIRDTIRKSVKYGQDDAKVDTWEFVQKMFFSVLDDNGVSLD